MDKLTAEQLDAYRRSIPEEEQIRSNWKFLYPSGSKKRKKNPWYNMYSRGCGDFFKNSHKTPHSARKASHAAVKRNFPKLTDENIPQPYPYEDYDDMFDKQ